MAYTFTDLAKDVLDTVKQPMSVNDVWEKALEMGLVQKLGSVGKTPVATLGARMYGDTKYGGENSIFVRVSNRPALFKLRGQADVDVANIQTPREKVPTFKERDLHKILSSYVLSDPHFSCYTTTIFHEKSKLKAKGQNAWLHPDIVGVRFPFQDYEDNARQLMKSMSVGICKLFSFELKTDINFSTLRESYFQAVSNSSWANEGYLVALKYDQDPEFLDEMRRLNNAFGIGFIRLDSEDYVQSEIILSAKNNEILDWNTISRLSEDNEDFKRFAHSVTKNLNVDELFSKDNFDKTFDTLDEFLAYVKDKKIKM